MGAGNSGRTPAATPDATPAGPLTAGGGTVRSALGPQVRFGYGVLDVKVTVTGSRITDVSVPTLQVIDPTSQQICEQVFPMLRSEVLSAQSAPPSAPASPAPPCTSASYAQSLQSALDKLHIKR